MLLFKSSGTEYVALIASSNSVYINCFDTQLWKKNGLFHRERDLAAIIWANGHKEWWINGKEYWPSLKKDK